MWTSQAVSSGGSGAGAGGSAASQRRTYSPPRTPPGALPSLSLPLSPSEPPLAAATRLNDTNGSSASASGPPPLLAGSQHLLGSNNGAGGVGISSAIMSRAGSLSGATTTSTSGDGLGNVDGNGSVSSLPQQHHETLLQQTYGRRQQYHHHHTASMSEDQSTIYGQEDKGDHRSSSNGGGGVGQGYVLDMHQSGGSGIGGAGVSSGGSGGGTGSAWNRLINATSGLGATLGLSGGGGGGGKGRFNKAKDRDEVDYVPLMSVNGGSKEGSKMAGDGVGVVGATIGDGKKKVSAAVIIPIWIALSSGVIVYNKWLYSTAGFPYPIFITSYHLGAAAVGTRLLRLFTPLMNGLDTVEMTRERYLKSIVPIGVLFSGSLILSNTAYLTLSVSFIQMLKAFTPVSVLLTSALLGIQKLNGRLMFIVILISLGTAMAAIGELHFELFGFVCQFSAVFFESSRLVMIQILLQGLKMDPLCSLHYYAPICAIINACFIPFTEGWAPFLAIPRIGFFVMFTNALNAFLLNVSAVFLIGAGGGLVLTLSGVFKDILLITSSTIFFGSSITALQIVGYAIALSGLLVFKLGGGK